MRFEIPKSPQMLRLSPWISIKARGSGLEGIPAKYSSSEGDSTNLGKLISMKAPLLARNSSPYSANQNLSYLNSKL